MSLTLLASPASPFARMVRVVLLETEQHDVDVEMLATTPLASEPALVAANPLGKLPALQRSDGPTIFDSRVICRFLDQRVGASLYPSDRLWEVLTLEALAHGIAEALLSCTYEQRFRPTGEQSEAWIEAQWMKASRAMEIVQAQWMSHLQGNLTAAQISLACALSYADLRHARRGWRSGRDELAGWHQGFSERASMRETVPPPA